MYWKISLLLLFLKINSIIGKCISTPDYNMLTNVHCASVDEEELLSFINGKKLKELYIGNSFIPQVELFPTNNLKLLTIKKSRVKTFLPTEFEKLTLLDLSFNEIKEICISKLRNLEKVVMHHNQIEFFNGTDLPSSLNNLDLSHNKIRNFTRLEGSYLYYLNLSYNSIEKTEGLLKHLYNVQIVDLSFNKLRNVNEGEFFNLNNLRHLNLSHNEIQTYIHPYYSIDHWNNYYFIDNYYGVFDLSYNEIKFSGEIFAQSFGPNYHLKVINLEKNNLKNLNFLISKKRKTIHGDTLTVRYNKITELLPLNFKGFILRGLDLSMNQIESIVPSTFEGLQVDGLHLDQNKIYALNSSSFFGISGLTRLNLSFNPLTFLDESILSNNSLLTSIDLSHCMLKNIPYGVFENQPSLFQINMSHNQIEWVKPFNIPSLQILNLSYNKIKNLPANLFCAPEILISLDLSYNPLGSIKNVFNNTKIEKLYLKGISLSVLSENDLAGLEKFEYLNLSHTGIKEISNNTFDQLVSLKTLILNNNSLATIPNNFFGFNTKLTSLSIINNPISIISPESFSHKMRLKYLNLTLTGKIFRKRFFNLIYLEELHFVNSLLTHIQKYSFKGLINLKTLNFPNSIVQNVEPGAFFGLSKVLNFDAQNLLANVTNLRSKIFVGLKSLKYLNVSSIGIAAIEDGAFFGLLSLYNLTLSHNKIGILPKNAFVGLRKLRMLDLSYNNLTGKESTFPIGIFSDLVELTDLHLQHNRIIKFHIGEFSNLRNLRFLNLSHNQLSYLDRHLLFPLRKLEVLDINSNYVIKFDYHFTLKHLSSLRTIGIGENKWPCENMTIMLNDFEQHGIDYREISKLEFEVENIGGIYCVHVCNYLYCPTEEDLVVTY